MIAMLYKNFQLGKRNMWMAPLYAVFYVFMFDNQLTMLAGGMIVGAYLFIMTVFGYEEQSKSLALNKALPISNGTIIASYYLGTVLAALYTALWSLIVLYIKTQIQHQLFAISLDKVIFSIIYALAVVAIYIPLNIRLGALKMRFVNMIMLVIVFAGTPLMAMSGREPTSTGAAFTLSIGLLGLAVLWFVSILLSIRFYKKKESD